MITSSEGINLARLVTLRQALKLEMLGMTRRGRSAYAIIKSEFNLKGSKKTVYNKFSEYIKEKEAEFFENKEIE